MKTTFKAIAVPGTHNFRDVGGLTTESGRRVRTGTLFRSDGLQYLTDEGRAAIDELGVRTSVDLRARAERDNALDALSASVHQVWVPIIDDLQGAEVPDGLEAVYRYMLEQRGTQLTAAVAALAASDALPAVVHCTAGKDRTGLVVALVLKSLGVDDQGVVDDYAATAALLTPAFLGALGVPQEAYGMVRSDPESMADVLGWLDAEHGGARGYLLAHGLDPADLDRLADHLLEATS